MPPKQKKVDPEKLKRQFEEYQQSDEYKQWQKLLQLKKEYQEISETTDDITGDWQRFHDELFKWGMIFKAKTKQKSIQHEHVRSFFFARFDKEVQYFDGVSNSTAQKDQSDRARSLRNFYIELYRGLDDIMELDENNFTQHRKTRLKCFNDFFKYLTAHIKQCHKEIYDQIQKVLEPLINIMCSNQRLLIFEIVFKNKEQREKVIFKETILYKQFCSDLQRCLKVLKDDKKEPIKITPDVTRILKKLFYPDWETNTIEAFYLKPLKLCLMKLRLRLAKLFSQGIDFWKLPLSTNQEFLEDVRDLLQTEIISDNLMQDLQKKDQLNFVYDTLEIIMKSPAKDKLKNKEESIMRTTIPFLITIQRMRKILDDKEKDKIEQEKFDNYNSQFLTSQMKENTQQMSSSLNNVISPESTIKKAQANKLAASKNRESIRLEEQPPSQEDIIYGRYNLWGDFLDQAHHEKLEQLVEDIRHINLAVQQDIQDNYITEGYQFNFSLVPRQENKTEQEYQQIQKESRNQIKQLKKVFNQQQEHMERTEINNKRPPNLWNHPDIDKEKHEYRSIAAPNQCYVDGRIQRFEDSLSQLVDHIMNHKQFIFKRPHHWKELIKRTIDCFNEQYDNKITLFGQEQVYQA